MRRQIRTAGVVLAATLTLGAAVGIARANQLEFSTRLIRVVWGATERLLFTDQGHVAVECEVTLEGSFHSAIISKSRDLLIGYVSRAALAGCQGGTATFLTETLPWHIRYDLYTGTLPRIRSVRIKLERLSVLLKRTVIEPASNKCLATSKPTESFAGYLELNEALTVTGLRADEVEPLELITLLTSAERCNSHLFVERTGKVMVLNSNTAISLRLV